MKKLIRRVVNAWRVLTGERVLFSSFEWRVSIIAKRAKDKYYNVQYEIGFSNGWKPKYTCYLSTLNQHISAETEDECINKLKVALGLPEVQPEEPAQLH